MATKLTDSQTASATGVVSVGFAASPIGGATYQASLGTATAAVVELQVRTGSSASWVVADTLTLSTGTPSLTVPVYPPYDAARWNVTSITGGNVNLSAIGVGA